MTITEQIAAVEARISANTEQFTNDGDATHEERIALTNRIREDAAVLRALKQAKEQQ